MNRIVRILASAMLIAVMMIPSAAFAATHDSTEDKSSDTATIYMGKVLAAAQTGKFPGINDFCFELEAVKAWDNANASTSASGTDIQASDMPMPQAVSGSHNSVTVSGTKASIKVGDFMGSANTAKADTGKEKFRVTPLNIRFSKAGYYMYKVTETGASPEDVPGMSYDRDSYYIVVYVCNKTDTDGNTVPGVYVHDITSYRNAPGGTAQPDLSDIQNNTDNQGKAAADNTPDNYSKVGKSSPDPGPDGETGLPKGPDKLEAYKFWNCMNTHDVVITNNVTGNLGDRTKEFEIRVTLSGLEKGATYTTDAKAEGKTTACETTASSDLVSASSGTIDSSAKTFTADNEGKAEFIIRLADDEVFVMNALPATAKYKAEELASDHIAAYSISATGNNPVIVKSADANKTDQQSIATSVETVDEITDIVRSRESNDKLNDGTVTIAFVNHRNLATITGVPYYGDHVYILCIMILIITAAMAVRAKRRHRNDADK